jgi:pilus assembly protein CpaB
MALGFFVVSLIAAVVLIGLGYMLFSSLQQNLDQISKGSDQIEVVVAKTDLHQGMALTAEDLRIAKIPRAYIPDTVYHSLTDVEGRTPRERILKGEAIRQERLAQPAAGRGLNAIIPTGQRAQQVELAGASSVSGFINPGNFVDVLVTGNDSNGMGQTTTLLQAVKVLAVDDRLETNSIGRRDRNSAPAVTVALTPYDAQRITEANAIGHITLTLRNDVDVNEMPVKGMKPNRFIGRKDQRINVAELAKKTAPPRQATTENTQKVIIQTGQTRKVIEK